LKRNRKKIFNFIIFFWVNMFMFIQKKIIKLKIFFLFLFKRKNLSL